MVVFTLLIFDVTLPFGFYDPYVRRTHSGVLL